MSNVFFLIFLFLGSVAATYLLWLVCHYNGKVIYYFIRIIVQKFSTSQTRFEPKELNAFYDRVSLGILCLLGILPLAILSVFTTTLNRCFNSTYAFILLETFLSFAFLLIPKTIKAQFDVLGLKIFKTNSALVFYSCLWCLIFSLWALENSYGGLDLMISNTNPDMWAYVRRFAAMTTDNLEFYGGNDSFTFESSSACAFFLGSPKKFSSFLGSLVISSFRDVSFGIAVFQGMLGCTLLICLFQNWLNVKFSTSREISFGKSILILWVLFSPPIYWLLISAYFSNALFLIIICLVLRETRQIAIQGNLETLENFCLLFATLTITFTFYPAFLPVLVFAYCVTALIYFPYQNSDREQLLRIILKLSVTILIFAIFSYTLFSPQIELYEVQKSLNPLAFHGSNFVPLNPWSLLQEKPKPMARLRDFGWYFNIIVGLMFSLFLGWKLWQKYKTHKQKDILAGLIGVGIYAGYLFAYVPLESTYRLMKIAISLVYPLAIFGLLPLVIWLKSCLEHKSFWVRYGILTLAIAHTIFHIYKVFDLNTFPAGHLSLSATNRLEEIQTLTIVGCKDVHVSQFYERLVGLQMAKQYPNLLVKVLSSPKDLTEKVQGDLVIYGEITLQESTQVNACRFELE